MHQRKQAETWSCLVCGARQPLTKQVGLLFSGCDARLSSRVIAAKLYCSSRTPGRIRPTGQDKIVQSEGVLLYGTVMYSSDAHLYTCGHTRICSTFLSVCINAAAMCSTIYCSHNLLRSVKPIVQHF